MQSITEILKGFDQPCPCGKKHPSALDMLVSGPGALARLPELLARYDAKKPFLLADRNTFAAAGGRVCEILTQAGFGYASCVFPDERLEPDEHAVGAAVMHFDDSCDLILGVGSGVINDIGKILSRVSGRHYMQAPHRPWRWMG